MFSSCKPSVLAQSTKRSLACALTPWNECWKENQQRKYDLGYSDQAKGLTMTKRVLISTSRLSTTFR